MANPDRGYRGNSTYGMGQNKHEEPIDVYKNRPDYWKYSSFSPDIPLPGERMHFPKPKLRNNSTNKVEQSSLGEAQPNSSEMDSLIDEGFSNIQDEKLRTTEELSTIVDFGNGNVESREINQDLSNI